MRVIRRTLSVMTTDTRHLDPVLSSRELMNTDRSASIPTLRRRWRLKISMEEAHLTASQMAELLGVSRATVTRWFADDNTLIRAAYIKQWAAQTGVPVRWLEHGEIHATPSGGGSVVTVAYAARARFRGPASAPFHNSRARTPLRAGAA